MSENSMSPIVPSIRNSPRGDTAGHNLTPNLLRISCCTAGVRRHISRSNAIDSGRAVGKDVAVGRGVAVSSGVGVGSTL